MRASRRRLLVAFALTASLVPTGAVGEGTFEDATQVGELDRFPNDVRRAFADLITDHPASFAPETKDLSGHSYRQTAGTLLPIPELRMLLQMWWFLRPDGSLHTGIAVRDMDTLELERTLVVPYPAARPNGSGEWMHAIDVKGRRLFLAAGRAENDTAAPTMIILDLKSFAWKHLVISLPVLTGAQWSPMGFSWDPVAGRIWGAWGQIGLFNVGVNLLGSIDPDLPDGADGIDGVRVMRGCRGPLPTLIHLNNFLGNYASGILRVRDRLYVPCHREGASGAIAVFDAVDALDPASAERLIVGPTEMTSVMNDTSVNRMLILTRAGDVWVFDAEREVFVGVIATGFPAAGDTALGLDRLDGRLFFLSPPLGLGIGEARYTPVGQGRTWPELGSSAPNSTSQEYLVSDGATGRLFVLDGTGGGQGTKARAYRILRVPSPLPPPGLRDPDRNTVDVEEAEGVTDAYFEGSSSGYGLRVLAAGGISPLVPAPAVGILSPSALIAAGLLNPKCGYTDRELAAGLVARTELSRGSASAEAIGVRLDERTQQDLLRPTRCDVETGRRQAHDSARFPGMFGAAPQAEGPVNSTLGQRWTQTPASCSEPGAGSTAPGGQPMLGAATTGCRPNEAAVEAHASGRLVGSVVVGESKASTRVFVDPERGTVSRSEAVASGVDLLDSVHIGEILQVAESWAHGRPGTASARRTITIRSVTVGTTELCSAVCDLETVVATLNQVFVGRAHVEIAPAPDPALFKGSPRGAQAAVQKSDLQVASDRALIGDVNREIPAIQMITYNDTSEWGRSRLVVQFAGVATASTYNIARVPIDSGPTAVVDPPVPPASGPPVAIDGPIGSAPVAPPIVDPVVRTLRRGTAIVLRGLDDALAAGSALVLFLWPLFFIGRRRLLALAKFGSSASGVTGPA